MAWTEERIQTLTTMWTDGYSASQIASELGGVSRNAVIGKVHRLGLSGRGAPTKASTPKRQGARTDTGPALAAKPTMQTHASKPATPKKAEAKPAKTATKDSQPQMASKPAEKGDKTPYAGQETKRPHLEEVGNVKLEDLKAGQCKWPHGDPLSPSFGFCGAPAEEGLPYCRRHAGKAYTTWRDEEAEAELEAAAANAGEAPADVAQQHSARRAAGSR